MTFGTQAIGLAGLTALVTGIAALFGAADLGTALGFGQIAFVLGLVYVLLRA